MTFNYSNTKFLASLIVLNKILIKKPNFLQISPLYKPNFLQIGVYNLKIYVKIMAEGRAACTAKVNNAQFYVYRNLESAKSLKAKKILNRVSQTGKVQRRIVFVSEEKFRAHFKIDAETIKKYIEEEKK